jgi:hypothetical protein
MIDTRGTIGATEHAATHCGPEVLLINPPMWNPYAPHLAVPLLTGLLRQNGFSVRAVDLGAEFLDFITSGPTLRQVRELLPGPAGPLAGSRSRALLDHLTERIAGYKATIRDVHALADPDRYERARRGFAETLAVVASAFGAHRFDLTHADLYHSARSTSEVLAAIADSRHNPYRWAFEQLLPPHLRPAELRMVGLSVSADTQLIAAMTVARMVRQLRPDVRIVLGGNFTTRMVTRWTRPHRFFDLADVFVMDEGEVPLLEITARTLDGRPVDDVPGICVVHGGELVKRRSVLADLNCSPTPDYTDYDLSRYLAPTPILPTMTSRSCAWNCTFCSIPFASGKFRNRHAAQVVDELDRLHEQTGSVHFMFVDEIMTLHSMRTVATELIRRGSPYFWYSETRFTKGLDAGVAKLLRDSGCRRLDLGLESYNQTTLDRMDKKVDVAVIEPNLRALIDARVPFHLFTIAGFPGETAEQTLRTADFARSLVRDAAIAGMPYATWAMGPFVLDLLSPVGRNPDKFGVTVIAPGPDEDLALSAHYRVSAGVDERGAAGLAMRDVARARHESASWRPASAEPLVEELTFLRAALELPMPDAYSRGELVPCGGSPRLRLAADALVLVTRLGSDGWLRQAVVSVERSLIVELPDELASALATDGYLIEAGQSAEHRQRIRALRRFGLLTADGEHFVNPRSARDRIRLSLEIGLRITTDADRTMLVDSDVTGQRVRLTGAAAAVLRASAGGVEARDVTDDDASRLLAALAGRLYDVGVLAVDVGAGLLTSRVPRAAAH